MLVSQFIQHLCRHLDRYLPVVLKCPHLIPALQRMNPLNFNDSITFPLAPPSEQTLQF